MWAPSSTAPPATAEPCPAAWSHPTQAAGPAGSIDNSIAGRARNVRETEDNTTTMAKVVAGDALFLSQLTPDSRKDLDIQPGQPVLALFKSIGVQVL